MLIKPNFCIEHFNDENNDWLKKEAGFKFTKPNLSLSLKYIIILAGKWGICSSCFQRRGRFR